MTFFISYQDSHTGLVVNDFQIQPILVKMPHVTNVISYIRSVSIFSVSKDGVEKYELLSMRKVLEHLIKSHEPLISKVM